MIEIQNITRYIEEKGCWKILIILIVDCHITIKLLIGQVLQSKQKIAICHR